MKDLTICYTSITPWMTQGLKLSGNKLSVYSIIYSMTQDDSFKSINTDYFCCFLKLTRREFYYAISYLVSKKYIDVKKEKGKKTFYKANSIAIKNAIEKSTKYFSSTKFKLAEDSSNKKQSIPDLIKEVHQENSADQSELTQKFSEDDRKQFRELMKHDWTYPGINFDSDSKFVK